ncbi:GlxA family transcriptional regulator [Klebsiella aerogenes]|uniref:GlxA family transcriptional regulator n=1 Tax=Klebsiella aerogenes TaxID=548 RepID=UPI002446AAFD|nr:helix-turn-helix domain-containing protein [Klebsiella aerogenes]MDH1612427.1 helix-turn-helix domain-containing protein [Klebsiella aerogenes]
MDNYRSGSEEEVSVSPLRPDIRIGLVLMNKFTLHSVAELIEPIRFAADVSFLSRQIFCQWEWMTCDNQPVTSSCGLTVTPTAPFNLHAEWDYVVFAGGLLDETRHPPPWLLREMTALQRQRIPIIALCSATFMVAKAGLLDGKKCAIHFTTRDEFRQRFPLVTPIIDQTYISDGGIISCPVGTSRALALDIIQQHCDELRAIKVHKYLLMEEEKKRSSASNSIRSGSELKTYDDELVRRAITYMRQHLSSPEPLHYITDYLHVSSRQLNQVFMHNTGETAAAYWRKLRLEQARKLMISSNVSINNIARSCGFSDASHLISWFRKQYGETPSDYRKRRRYVGRLIHPS